MEEESFMPLKEATADDDGSNNKKTLERKNSYGSGSDIELAHKGEADTLDFRIRAVDASGKKLISLWHDISLPHINPVTRERTPFLNFVCEIPKCSRKKYEIATDEIGNPIKQDEKKGTLREFKKGDIYFNYGCFPQTWEDPTFCHPDADGCRGDNDPLDVVEIGLRIISPGDIRPVKVLGILCMIDEGECDWKVVVIDAEDKWAPFLNDIGDVEEQLPGTLSSIREWYRTYKIPDGKPPNVFGLDERFMNRLYALQIIKECHHAWEMLVSGEKERQIAEHYDDGVKSLVRKLSTGSLFDLAPNMDEHPEAHPNDYADDEEDDAPSF